MPATYSFSLNLRKDRDIIELMEGARNKSFLIRKALHSINRLEVYELYASKLERLIRAYTKELEWECPNFRQTLDHCYDVKEEGQPKIELVPQEVHNSFQEPE